MSAYKPLLVRAEGRLNYEMLLYFRQPQAVERWDLWQSRFKLLTALDKIVESDTYDAELHSKLIILIRQALDAGRAGKQATADRLWLRVMKLAPEPKPTKKRKK